jgi:hypothetical protein
MYTNPRRDQRTQVTCVIPCIVCAQSPHGSTEHIIVLMSAADAWQEVQDAGQEMREHDRRRYERWAESSDDDYYTAKQ